MKTETPQEYLAKIGAEGGRKSRRKLTKKQAREMVKARERKRAARLGVEWVKAARAELNDAYRALEWSKTEDDTSHQDFWAAEILRLKLALVEALASERAAGVALKPCEQDGARSTTARIRDDAPPTP